VTTNKTNTTEMCNVKKKIYPIISNLIDYLFVNVWTNHSFYNLI